MDRVLGRMFGGIGGKPERLFALRDRGLAGSLLSMYIRPGLLSPFRSIRASIVVPTFKAISLNVSPLSTLYFRPAYIAEDQFSTAVAT